MEQTRTIWQCTRSGATGGLVAGALLGLFEVALAEALQGSGTGLAALPWATAIYALLYAALGSIVGSAWGAWTTCRSLRRPLLPWLNYAVALGLLLLLLVTMYQLWDKVLQSMAIGSGGVGLLLAGGVLIVLDLAAVVALALWHRLQDRVPTQLYRLRSGVLIGSAVIALAVGAAGAGRIGQAVAVPPIPPTLRDAPNVILIVADTLRADHLGCYGYQAARTPNLDALAADGVRYADMTAQASWTKPSVATILSSMYPSSHRATRRDSRLPQAVTTLPEILDAHGYQNAAFTSNVNMAPLFQFQQGFRDYVYLDADRVLPDSRVSTHLSMYLGLWDRLTQREGSARVEDYYQDAVTTNRHALAWLDANHRSRFFLYIHYMDPHQPYFERPYTGRALGAVPQQTDLALGPEMSRLYDGEIAYLDTQLGAVFQTLRRHGLYDEALIVFTADHGEEFFEHGDCEHGWTLYDEQIRVPLIVKYPRGAGAGTVDRDPARSLDIAPTVLDVLHVEIPTTMQGISLHPDSPATRATKVFSEQDHEGNVLQAIRTSEHKLILANPDNPRGLAPIELYDLAVDPGEQRNLATNRPEIVQRLQADLDRALAYALAHAVAEETGELDAATRERLRQLGY